MHLYLVDGIVLFRVVVRERVPVVSMIVYVIDVCAGHVGESGGWYPLNGVYHCRSDLVDGHCYFVASADIVLLHGEIRVRVYRDGG